MGRQSETFIYHRGIAGPAPVVLRWKGKKNERERGSGERISVERRMSKRIWTGSVWWCCGRSRLRCLFCLFSRVSIWISSEMKNRPKIIQATMCAWPLTSLLWCHPGLMLPMSSLRCEHSNLLLSAAGYDFNFFFFTPDTLSETADPFWLDIGLGQCDDNIIFQINVDHPSIFFYLSRVSSQGQQLKERSQDILLLRHLDQVFQGSLKALPAGRHQPHFHFMFQNGLAQLCPGQASVGLAWPPLLLHYNRHQITLIVLRCL